ncbi:unnamed protein product [Musa textilis]
MVILSSTHAGYIITSLYILYLNSTMHIVSQPNLLYGIDM